MRKFSLILSVCFAFISFSAVAHDGEEHAAHAARPLLDSRGASESAQHVIAQGIERNMLPVSWGNVTSESAEKKMGKEKYEWVVIFNNKSIEDPAEQTLYVFLTLDGRYIAANFTGI